MVHELQCINYILQIYVCDLYTSYPYKGYGMIFVYLHLFITERLVYTNISAPLFYLFKNKTKGLQDML